MRARVYDDHNFWQRCMRRKPGGAVEERVRPDSVEVPGSSGRRACNTTHHARTQSPHSVILTICNENGPSRRTACSFNNHSVRRVQSRDGGSTVDATRDAQLTCDGLNPAPVRRRGRGRRQKRCRGDRRRYGRTRTG